MKCNQPFLVAAGQISDDEMEVGSIALSALWGGFLNQFTCYDSPNKVLNDLPDEDGLILLKGDAGQSYYEGPSWIEALGAWKKPVILFVSPTVSGNTSGIAFAYEALCKKLSIPLIGLVQIGGPWNIEKKKFDNLPWCGWLPSNQKEALSLKKVEKSDGFMETYIVVERLRNSALSLCL